MPLKPGDTLLNGQYQILALLGRGGFGFVYRARDTHLGEDVAIKELIPTLIGDAAMLKRFLAEAKAAMRLRHDRLVATHHVFPERDNYYIIMDYMPGGSLEDRLREGLLDVDASVRIAAEVCEALAYAHRHGVVHCDLKPANILFGADGGARLADFGIAHVSEQMLSKSWQTPAGFVAGTLPYMSPEQADGERCDPRIDLYALGAVLYRMLTGRTYLDFDASDTPRAQAENVHRIYQEQPLPPSARRAGIPPWLDAAVLRALSKRPDDRFASAEALAAALLRSDTVAPRPTTAIPAASRPARSTSAPAASSAASSGLTGVRGALSASRRTTQIWLMAGSAVVLVLVAVAVVLLLSGPRGKPTPTPAAAALVTASAGPRPSEASTPSYTPAPTLTPTRAPEPSQTPKPTSTPRPQPTSTPAPTRTAEPTRKPTGTPRPATATALGGGGRIAFSSDRDGNWEIYVMDSDGSGVTRLTDDAAYDEEPAWSPDGRRIAFHSDRSGNWDIFVMNADGSRVTRLTDSPANEGYAAWSPDGRRAAFVSKREGNYEVYVVNVDGSGLTRLTDNTRYDWDPAWSPDGRRIAFTSSQEIYIMNADGSGQTNLTNNAAQDSYPAWSPDGRRIAFTSDRDGNWEVYVMNADGSGQKRLTNDPAFESSPAWSPDGRRIAFASDRDGNKEIYVMNADGSAVIRLTDNAGSDELPAWSGR